MGAMSKAIYYVREHDLITPGFSKTELDRDRAIKYLVATLFRLGIL